MISVIGRIFNLFFHSIAPTENSLPSMNSSIKIISSSLNAIFTAFSRSFGSFTLLTPILLPPEFGFTKQGNLILSYINFKSFLFSSLMLLGVLIPILFAFLLQLNLSCVNLAISGVKLLLWMFSLFRYAINC